MQELISGNVELGQFEGGNKVVLSPDGRYLYATANLSSAIVLFQRDVVTGKLTRLETIPTPDLMSAPGPMRVSPDGKFIYVGLQDADGLLILNRAAEQ